MKPAVPVLAMLLIVLIMACCIAMAQARSLPRIGLPLMISLVLACLLFEILL